MEDGQMKLTEPALTCDAARHATLDGAFNDGWQAGFAAGQAIGAETALLAVKTYLPADLADIPAGNEWARMVARRAQDPADLACPCGRCSTCARIAAAAEDGREV